MINFAIWLCFFVMIWQMFVSKYWTVWPIMIVVLLIIKFTSWGSDKPKKKRKGRHW